MKVPTWTKPGVTGAILGSVATMILGFTQGGWYSDSSAESLAKERSAVAVIEALVPVCVSQSKSGLDASTRLDELGALKTSYERRDYVMKAGWATMPAEESPNRDLASACAEMLSKPAAG